MPPKYNAKKGAAGRSHGAISDSRFKNFETDPRFRLPGRKDKKVTIDNRFSRMLDDEDFAAKASVDRYGRKLPKGAAAEKLRKKFVVEDEGEDGVDADEEVQAELARVNGTYDPARHGGFEESSSSEDESSSEGSSGDDDSEDETSYREVEQGLNVQGDEKHEGKDAEMPLEDASARLALVNLDWDNIRAVDLMAVARSFCPEDGKILSVQVLPSEFGKERMQREEMEGPPKELFASTSNEAQQNGSKIEDASDSEEHENGDDDQDDDEDDEKIKAKILAQSTSEEANAEVNSSALRKYQLTRLRYYYAVLACDSSSTALALYRNMDGREYLSSANFFDLRFIPDEVDFEDDTPRDECTKVPAGYYPNEFVTEALTHSKVKLTWDAEEDKARKETQKRAFKAGEGEDVDVRAYLASDTSDESEDSNEQDSKGKRQSKAEAAREQIRAALGLSAGKEAREGKKPKRSEETSTKKSTKEHKSVGDMQITFIAGLSNGKNTDDNSQSNSKDTSRDNIASSVFVNKPEDVREETTREKYIRKERERKQRRKDRARSRREGEDVAAEEEEEEVSNAPDSDDGNGNDEDDPFADPFFNDPVSANEKLKMDAKKSKRKAAQEQESKDAGRKAKERAELELLMAGEDERSGAVSGGHFDMADIKKAERAKDKYKKSSKHERKSKNEKKQAEDAAAPVGDFDINVKDPRFASLYNSHEFAIDPSHARFSGTQSMKKVLEEGRKRRHEQREGDEDAVERNPAGTRNIKNAQGSEIDDLVSKVKKRRVVT